jgi:hypothetical protein
MLSPLPRRSGWAYSSLCFTQPCQPSPKGLSGRPAHRPFRGLLGVHSRYGPRTRAVTVYRDTHSEGFSYFVTSIAAPVASGWSGCRVGFAPTGKRRLLTAHTRNGHPSQKLDDELGNVAARCRHCPELPLGAPRIDRALPQSHSCAAGGGLSRLQVWNDAHAQRASGRQPCTGPLSAGTGNRLCPPDCLTSRDRSA